MRAEMRKETRGSTLVELMVAIVLLAIVVMFIALIPTQSQQMMFKADRVSAAAAGARDKVEAFRHVIGRTGSTYKGFNVLMATYPSGRAFTDTFRFSEIPVVRTWVFRWPTGAPGDSGWGSLDLKCLGLVNGRPPKDSLDTRVWINTLVAKRDTLPL